MADPQTNPALSPEEKDRALAWLKRHAPDGFRCYVCGNKAWHLADHFVTPTASRPDAPLMLGGTVYPQFMLVCLTCGHTVYFNAVLSGIIQPPEPTKPDG